MKKFLLLTFVASLFAAGSAFAHCGACGAEEAADHEHAAKACCGTEGECCKDKSDCAKSECAAKCAKSCESKCCGEDGKCCKKACAKSCEAKCCGEDGKCCKKAKCCGEDGKCCKAKDETAVAAPPACCPASKPA